MLTWILTTVCTWAVFIILSGNATLIQIVKSALHGGYWLASCPRPFIPKERARRFRWDVKKENLCIHHKSNPNSLGTTDSSHFHFRFEAVKLMYQSSGVKAVLESARSALMQLGTLVRHLRVFLEFPHVAINEIGGSSSKQTYTVICCTQTAVFISQATLHKTNGSTCLRDNLNACAS